MKTLLVWIRQRPLLGAFCVGVAINAVPASIVAALTIMMFIDPNPGAIPIHILYLFPWWGVLHALCGAIGQGVPYCVETSFDDLQTLPAFFLQLGLAVLFYSALLTPLLWPLLRIIRIKR